MKKEELAKALEEKSRKLKTFRFGMSAGKVKNVKEGRLIKKDIARIMTEMNKSKNTNTSNKLNTNTSNRKTNTPD